jgi:hypothetical protein
MNPKKYLLIVMVSAMMACDGEPEPFVGSQMTPDNVGYRPVYGEQDHSEVAWTDPQPISNPGKIYLYRSYLLVNELKQGIHVFDNTNPQFPVALGFLRLLGNTDLAVKDDVLYADHMGNLVALTIQDFAAVQEKGRLTLANWNRGVPPPSGYYFECVDSSKGFVIGWKKTEKQNMKCYALR